MGLSFNPRGSLALPIPAPWGRTSRKDSTLFLWQLVLSVHSSKENRGVGPQGQSRSQGSGLWPLEVSVQP